MLIIATNCSCGRSKQREQRRVHRPRHEGHNLNLYKYLEVNTEESCRTILLLDGDVCCHNLATLHAKKTPSSRLRMEKCLYTSSVSQTQDRSLNLVVRTRPYVPLPTRLLRFADKLEARIINITTQQGLNKSIDLSQIRCGWCEEYTPSTTFLDRFDRWYTLDVPTTLVYSSP